MQNTNEPSALEDLHEFVRQLEGVENNANVTRTLTEIFTLIAKDHTDTAEQLTLVMGVMEAVYERAWEGLREMRELPVEDHHYMFNGEISAQEAFVAILAEAYDPSVACNNEARIAFVVERAEALAAEAEEAVAEPLAKIRELVANLPQEEESQGAPSNVTIH